MNALPGSSLTALARLRSCVHPLSRCAEADWLHCAALMVVGLLVRARGWSGQRIWDDQYLSLENPFIKSPLLILECFRHYLFLDSFSTHYRPVQNISYLFDYFFWNADPFGFHLTNGLLHATGGALLYFLLRQILTSLWLPQVPVATRNRLQKRLRRLALTAFLIALLWSVHPVHSAAVDYIAGRADSLAFCFAAGGWLLVFRGRACKTARLRWAFFGSAAFSGLLSILSREIACVWFAIFLGHLIFVERNLTRRARLVAVAGCLLLVGIYAGMRHLPEARANPPASNGWSAPVRIVLMARSLGDYSRLMFLPGNLHMERTILDGDSYRSNSSWRGAVGVEYLSILGLGAGAALLAGCAVRGRGRVLRVFGTAWFFAGYLPVSNLISLNATVAEHWLYLPSVGILIFLAGCAVDLPLRLRQPSIAFACLAVVGLSARSLVRSTDWADEKTFYTRTIAAGGASTRAAANLAEVYSREGNTEGAERVFRRVLAVAPEYPMARNNFANLLHKSGRKKEAETMFDSSTKDAVDARHDYPGTWVAALNLAHIRLAAGDKVGAMQILERARQDYPQTWDVIRLQAEVYRLSGRAEEAQRSVENFVKANWWHHDARIALGRLYAQQGDADRATAAWRFASWLDVHDAESLNLIADLRLRQNRLDDAFEAQSRAVSRQPDEPRQYRRLSEILTKMGRADEARAALAQVSQMEAFARSQAVPN